MEGVFSVGLSGTVYKIETDLHFESNQLQNQLLLSPYKRKT